VNTFLTTLIQWCPRRRVAGQPRAIAEAAFGAEPDWPVVDCRSCTEKLRRAGGTVLPVAIGAAEGLVVNGPGTGPSLWVALAASAALLVRRRLPEVALAAGLPGLYLGFIAFAPLIALYSLAVRRRGAVTAGVGATLVSLGQFLPCPLGDVAQLQVDHDTVLLALDACALGVGAVVLGRSTRLRHDRLREMTESREREHRLLAEHTLATERVRLAREMHDVVAHKVSLISLQAGVLQVGEADAVTVRQTATVIRELSVSTLTELQHLVGVLRGAGGAAHALAPQSRLADLPTLIRDSGLPVTLRLGHVSTDLPETVERAAYRTVQEALTNVRKHAPGADVSVSVRTEHQCLSVEVCNTSSPPNVEAQNLPAGGHGLIGLQERAHMLGGSFSAGPLPHGGYRVMARFPLAGKSPRIARRHRRGGTTIRRHGHGWQ
jgi:signal transduction histidine kinase